jgi:hypothetical protein
MPPMQKKSVSELPQIFFCLQQVKNYKFYFDNLPSNMPQLLGLKHIW